jgi:hypothetical protein
MDGMAEPGARKRLVDLGGCLDVADGLGELLGGAVDGLERGQALEEVVADRGAR